MGGLSGQGSDALWVYKVKEVSVHTSEVEEEVGNGVSGLHFVGRRES